ncbi:tryptophan synthase beta subunit-like PLP-dependent enzyme [Stipitochalara longipes BDJ]|nr:tryptophan synthase beta subunit-like PLP-dependent enzyme [Stipitochalara longipes BDJ]
MDVENIDKRPTRRSIYLNPAAKSYKAPETKDNSAELQAFYKSLPDYAPTRLVPLPDLAAELGVRSVYIKAETSRLGLPSFKLLGASWAVRQAIIHLAKIPSSSSLDNLRAAVNQHSIKLCAATDGNHGRSVAFMGRLLGVEEIKVFVPRGLDEKIIASIANEGANVVIADGDYDHTVRTAHRFGEDMEGFMLIEAVAYEGYEDVPRWAVEGYTTMLREIDAQLLIHAQIQKKDQPLSMIIAPVGVGSFTQAILTYYKSPNNISRPPAVVTAEPDTAATLHKSLKAKKSLSISTSPTIMAGLECGTLSSIAWPLLKEGVDISTTISDWECHQAIEYMKKYRVGAGPCGGAALAGLRHLSADPTSKGVLNKDSVVVCICTEGSRPYTFPTPVDGSQLSLVSALMVLHMTPSIQPGWSIEKIPVVAALNYIAQWFEYRDVDVSWVDYGTSDASLVVKLPGVGKTESSEKGKSLLLICQIPSTTDREALDLYTSLGAAVLAVAQLNVSAKGARGDITLAIVPSVSGFKSVLQGLGTLDAGLLVDIAAGFDLFTVRVGMNFEFSRAVKESVRSALGRDVTLRNVSPSPGGVLDVLKEKNVHAMALGFLGGKLVQDQSNEEAEHMMARALMQIGKDWCH